MYVRFWKRVLGLMKNHNKDVKTSDAPPLMYIIPQEHMEQVFELWDESRNDPGSSAARFRLWSFVEASLGGKTNIQSGMRWQLRALNCLTLHVINIPNKE